MHKKANGRLFIETWHFKKNRANGRVISDTVCDNVICWYRFQKPVSETRFSSYPLIFLLESIVC